MLAHLPTFILPVLIGVVVLTAMEILRVLGAWKAEAASLHELKVETHTLRLRLKQQSAERIFAEEQHRARFTTSLLAA